RSGSCGEHRASAKVCDADPAARQGVNEQALLVTAFRAVALELSFFEAAYVGRTDGGIRCGLRGQGSSGWPPEMPRLGLGGRGWSRPRPREVPPFRSPM